MILKGVFLQNKYISCTLRIILIPIPLYFCMLTFTYFYLQLSI